MRRGRHPRQPAYAAGNVNEPLFLPSEGGQGPFQVDARIEIEFALHGELAGQSGERVGAYAC